MLCWVLAMKYLSVSAGRKSVGESVVVSVYTVLDVYHGLLGISDGICVLLMVFESPHCFYRR